MKKIGREVLFLKTGKDNPRNGEGAFIRLKDGQILYLFTKYNGNDWGDHCSADIYGIYSRDEGESWYGERLIQKRDDGAENYMSISAIRMENDDIGLFYIRKNTRTDGKMNCKLTLIRSSDEGEHWSAPIDCIGKDGYFVVNNDRVIRLQNGRLIFPANLHEYDTSSESGICGIGTKCIFASDDDGKTWTEIGERQSLSSNCITDTGLQETGLYQFGSGRIWAWSRTDMAFQYECFSDDNGITWTEPVANKLFSSPTSPMQVKRVGNYTVAIFNPVPIYTTIDASRPWGRTPYACAVSDDDGKTFPRIFYIEDDLTNGYCYPAIIEGDDYFLVAYYHSNNTGICLNSNKIIKILFDEIK